MLAIVDDIGAVLVIAVFYTDDLSLPWLATAVVLLAGVAALRWLRVWYLPVYGLMGVAVWLAAFESGIHAAVATRRSDCSPPCTHSSPAMRPKHLPARMRG